MTLGISSTWAMGFCPKPRSKTCSFWWIMSIITPELLQKFDRSAPRYTSYPTAPTWKALSSENYEEQLRNIGGNPLSLYLHIPFCHSMCLFCGCSVILNRRPEKEERYTEALCQEIKLVAEKLGQRSPLTQLHFGGGTPTKLSEPLLEKIWEQLEQHFDFTDEAEISIEIDPRTVYEDEGSKLTFLRNLGFNRVSFGVQDLDPAVQEAVRRRQSEEMTRFCYKKARKLNFQEINFDLIYGLPCQTQESFRKTIESILEMRPDRIAFFSYAKVPWLKPHQKSIPDVLLPTTDEKFHLYAKAREAFVKAGYQAIGMDHFALKTSALAQSYQEKTLHRNFQGYTIKKAPYLLGLGVTSIGDAGTLYAQNSKDLSAYYQRIDQGELPVEKGLVLSQEDHLRKWVILSLMCQFRLCKKSFFQEFDCDFDEHFSQEMEALKNLEEDGLVHLSSQEIHVTSLGELFVRLIAMVFDAYLEKPSLVKPQYSQSI